VDSKGGNGIAELGLRDLDLLTVSPFSLVVFAASLFGW
jgi:hypothetical protein